MKLRLLTHLSCAAGWFAAGSEIESESLGIDPQALLVSGSAVEVPAAAVPAVEPEAAKPEPTPPVQTMERKARAGRRTSKREG